jgi:GTP-binding protein Era
MTHKSGFVNIIGSPNVGKSTLMNALVGERLSIITSKAQTTRHRIFGIVNGMDYQIVYSDTPGLVNAAYKLHEHMMSYVKSALKDADILLFITDGIEKKTNHEATLETLQKMDHLPILVLINKIDLLDQERVMARIAYWQELLPRAEVMPISALHKFNLEKVYERILELLPEGPAYFDKDQLTDRPMRFFISEMIREKIFLHYEKEIPYSTEVVVESYQEEGDLVKIRALIMVERESQKNIIIGKGGSMINRVGREARKDMERFIERKVYLDLFVKVDPAWRNKDNRLRFYGYSE